jgi:transposase
MSLRLQTSGPVPEETVRVARAAYPKGNLYLSLRDHLGTIYEDRQFAALYPKVGQPAHAPWRLALICILQFLEGLSDRQAADAVRGRIDWKYLLGLDLIDPGFDHTVLSEFRIRLVSKQSEHLLFETLLTQLRGHGYLKERRRQRSDSTHILAMVHAQSLGGMRRGNLSSCAQYAGNGSPRVVSGSLIC